VPTNCLGGIGPLGEFVMHLIQVVEDVLAISFDCDLAGTLRAPAAVVGAGVW
jgi:hypothetical protein